MSRGLGDVYKRQMGMGADVTVFDISLPKLRELDARYEHRIKTLASSPYEIARQLMEQISDELRREPEVAQLFFLGGTEDFLIHVRVRDSAHVRQFVLKNLSANPAVALTETNLVFEHHTALSAGLRTVL